MNLARAAARRTGNVPWWVFSPAALIAVVVVLLGVAMLGAISSPATGAAAEAEARAAICTVTPPADTSGTASVGAGGPGPTTSITNGGSGGGVLVLSAPQMLNAQTITAVGKAADAPTAAVAVALAASYVDTDLSATADIGGGIAAGLFLQTAADYPGVNRTDPAAAAAAFYDRLLALPAYISGQSLGVVADAMQHTDAGVDDYQARAGWATTLATTLTNGTAGTVENDSGAAGSAVVCTGGAGDGTVFDPGNIISDQVFYNSLAMTADQIRAFLVQHGAGCPDSNPWCVKNLQLTSPARPADAFCTAYPGGTDQDVATVLAGISTACGVNPQVMLTTLQKESQGLTRTNPGPSSWDSAWGWGCPDTGPGGTANCATSDRGFANQAWQMAHQWAKYRTEIPSGRYNYSVGTYRILWNVAETGCGGADVTIANVATASLYVYTPYQPNAASLAAYPGEGDRCSSYGNRNFFYLFRSYFGSTGGGKAGPGSGGPIEVDGPVITLPPAAGVTGTVTAPNTAVATVITAGLGWLGTDYSWGGGGPTGPTTGICTPGGVTFDACHVVGFDCSGLMLHVWAQVGINLPRYSQDQLKAGPLIPYSQAVAGDLIGYPGHVAMFLATINGVDYMLEAPYTGSVVRVAPVRKGHYANVTRLWAGLS